MKRISQVGVGSLTTDGCTALHDIGEAKLLSNYVIPHGMNTFIDKELHHVFLQKTGDIQVTPGGVRLQIENMNVGRPTGPDEIHQVIKILEADLFAVQVENC